MRGLSRERWMKSFRTMLLQVLRSTSTLPAMWLLLRSTTDFDVQCARLHDDLTHRQLSWRRAAEGSNLLMSGLLSSLPSMTLEKSATTGRRTFE
ncbi:unnamed protein product [Amoebophrya sp. A25]|nr:unnamed protein product [Amoebophrya sp. A25]|eukprot:GSA25T00027367001.1